MKVIDLIAYGIGAIIGAVLGMAGFRLVYLPIRTGLGLDFAALQASGEEGPIVPMKTFFPLYLTAGTAIDFLVLLAFVTAGILAVLGIVRATRKR